MSRTIALTFALGALLALGACVPYQTYHYGPGPYRGPTIHLYSYQPPPAHWGPGRYGHGHDRSHRRRHW